MRDLLCNSLYSCEHWLSCNEPYGYGNPYGYGDGTPEYGECGFPARFVCDEGDKGAEESYEHNAADDLVYHFSFSFSSRALARWAMS